MIVAEFQQLMFSLTMEYTFNAIHEIDFFLFVRETSYKLFVYTLFGFIAYQPL